MVSRSSLQSRVRLLCRNYAGYYLFQILLTDDAGSNAGFDARFVPSSMPDLFPLRCWIFSSLCRNDDAEYDAGFDAGYVPSSMLDMFPLYAGILPHINLLPDIIN